MKKLLAFITFGILSTASAAQTGLLLGGSIGVKDHPESFDLTTFYASKPFESNSALRAYVPLSMMLGDGFIGVRAIPGVEYDLHKFKLENKDFTLSGTAGLSLRYTHADSPFPGFSSADGFAIGIAPALFIRGDLTDKIGIRFSPLGLDFVSWGYTKSGSSSNSDFDLSVAYMIQIGLTYNF